MSTAFDTDKFLHRLRERQTEAQENEYDDGHGDCPNCNAQLTVTDVEARECTRCGLSLEIVNDESRDEDLWEE